MVEKTTILIVEDNEDLAFGLRTNLEVQGYHVVVAMDGPSGLHEARKTSPDLMILDLMLPQMNGMEVLKQLRAQGSSMPILILTAKGNEIDKVNGLRLGADDYVTKPFGLMELMARVEALLRRSAIKNPPTPGTLSYANVEVNLAARQVWRNGKALDLTPREYELLVALLRREGAVASRLELMREVWGHSSSVISRTVDTHIAELRRKLESDPANPKHILTVRKAGYRLQK